MKPDPRESIGPLSSSFRGIAGDRLIDKLTVVDENTVSPQLHREWRDYVDAFASYYALPDDKHKRALEILEQREKDTLTYLVSKSEEVTKISPHPPALKLNMTMTERLKEHDRLQNKVAEIEATFPTLSKDDHAKWKSAKADLNKWRVELQKSLDGEKEKVKKALEDVLTSEDKLKQAMPHPKMPPIGSWQLLEWSDFLVKWSLVVLGSCLMLGLFSRLSSLGMAPLLFSFYLAMPPLPGWPDSPRMEGNYLLINKTLIEVIALLALACIPTGRWAGLDGVLQFLGRSKKPN